MKGKIFTAHQVQSMIAGNMTMFREVIKPQPRKDVLEYTADRINLLDKSPYQVGQKIFCKEVWGIEKYGENGEYEDSYGEPTRTSICYKSDGDKTPITNHWNTAKSMPQWASRLTLLIKEIRVERLASISIDDCYKEGVPYEPECCQNYIAVADCNGNPTPSCCNNPNVVHPKPHFEYIWNATHKKPEEKFEASPWVFVYSFEVVK